MCTAFAVANFPRAFSIVELDLEMDRASALSEARRLAGELGWGPTDYRQAASFRPGEWTEMSQVASGLGPQHRFVWSEAGENAFRALLGEYVGRPRWRVRYARFEGDVAARAEEHVVWIDADGTPGRREHGLAEATPGAALPEEDARTLARDALARGPRCRRRSGPEACGVTRVQLAVSMLARVTTSSDRPALVVVAAAAMTVPDILDRGLDQAYGGALLGSLRVRWWSRASRGAGSRI